MSDFRPAWAAWLWYETSNRPDGGLHDDPSDPGGVTKWGIAQRAYPLVDVARLSEQAAAEIVRRDYWDTWRLGNVRVQRSATTMLLALGNMRQSDAVRALQRACRFAACYGSARPEEDGRLGPVTLAAFNSLPPLQGWQALASEVVSEYADRAARRPASRQYLGGWIARARLVGMPPEVEALAASLEPLGQTAVVVAAEPGEPGSEGSDV